MPASFALASRCYARRMSLETTSSDTLTLSVEYEDEDGRRVAQRVVVRDIASMSLTFRVDSNEPDSQRS